MKDSRKLFSLVLAGIMSASAILTSCNNTGDSKTTTNTSADTTTADTTTAETAPETESVYDLLPERNYDGQAFHVLTSSGWSQDMPDQIYVEEPSGDVVLNAVYERNAAVESAYNAIVDCRTIPYGDLAAAIRQEAQSGETGTDLIVHSPTQLAPLAAERMFLDIGELPYTDMSRPWYEQSVNEELEIAGKQYLFLTDMGFVFASCVGVMLYNVDMAEQLDIEGLQEMALDGDWTLDEFSQYMALATDDLNGDGTMDKDDRFGIALYWNEMTDVFPYSLGQKLTEKDESGRPQLVLGSERMSTIVTRLNSIFNDSGDCLVVTDSWKTQQEMFRDGHTLFCVLNISSIPKRLREMEDDYAALPMPKLDETQSAYYTSVSRNSTTIFAVADSTPDHEFTSVMLEALSAEGAEKVMPAYVEQAVKLKYADSVHDFEIYDLIFDGVIIDFGALYDDTGIYTLFRELMQNNSNDFMSRFTSRQSATEANYEKIWNTYLSHTED